MPVAFLRSRREKCCKIGPDGSKENTKRWLQQSVTRHRSELDRRAYLHPQRFLSPLCTILDTIDLLSQGFVWPGQGTWGWCERRAFVYVRIALVNLRLQNEHRWAEYPASNTLSGLKYLSSNDVGSSHISQRHAHRNRMVSTQYRNALLLKSLSNAVQDDLIFLWDAANALALRWSRSRFVVTLGPVVAFCCCFLLECRHGSRLSVRHCCRRFGCRCFIRLQGLH